MDSILTTVKKNLGIQEDYTHFDLDLIVYINAAFSTLHQLGIGPDEDYSITSDSEVWTDFMPDGTYMGMIQSYVSLYAKMIFDPPQSSAVMEFYKARLNEFEFRLNVEFDKSWDGDD